MFIRKTDLSTVVAANVKPRVTPTAQKAVYIYEQKPTKTPRATHAVRSTTEYTMKPY